MIVSRRLIATGLVAWLVAVGRMFLVVPPAAKADEQWGVLGSFGRSPGDSEPLSGPTWLAADPAAGVVYVVDAGNDRVERFTTTGSYLGQFDGAGAPTGVFSSPGGIAVDNDPASASFEDVYVIDTGHDVIDKFSATGGYLGQITGTCPASGPCTSTTLVPFAGLPGVAVDSKGVVWVENGVVGIFGAPLGSAGLDTFTGAQPNTHLASHEEVVAGGFIKQGLAVDSGDDVYLIFQFEGFVMKLSSTGETLGQNLDGIEGATDLAVEPQSNNLFIDDGSSVMVLNPASALVESFGSGLLDGSAGVALDPAAGTSGYVYLSEPALGEVLLLEHSNTPQPPPTAPVTSAVTDVSANSATLNGVLDPEGATGGVGYYFTYDNSTSCTETGSVHTALDDGATNPTVEETVSTTATGLIPSTEYTVCLVADKFGVSVGSQQSFTTPGAPPLVISQAAENFEEERGKFRTVVNPNHSPGETTVSFEYSTEGSVAGNTLSGTISTVAGSEAIPAGEYGERIVTSFFAGLTPPGATYYYRVVATNEAGTTDGPVKAYTKAPVISAQSSSGLTLSSASIKASVNQEFQSTTWAFEYSTSRSELEHANGIEIEGTEPISANEEPLPSSTCHDGNPPISSTPTPSSETTFSCEDGSQPACADEATPTPWNGSLICPSPITAKLTGLQENTTYYYRAVAANASTENPQSPGAGAPSTGPIMAFTTESLPIVATGAAENISRTAATLSGAVTPLDQTTSYYYEYIPQAGYQTALANHAADPYQEGETTSPVTLPASSEPHAAGPVAASGLLPETTYHYRLAAKNEWGVRYATDHTFTTTGKILPEATTGPPTAITQTNATITATVTTNGLKTSYGFQITTTPGDYGPTTGLGTISGAATETITENLNELQPGTTYTYRVTASNVDGTVYGTEQTFTTTPLPNLLTTPPTPPTLNPIPPFELPTEQPPTTKKTLTKKQLLAKALHTCKKTKNKTKRTHCEKTARAKYKTHTTKHHTKK